MSQTTIGEVPIFPLNTVLFPDGLLPLRIFEARYMDMARNALRTGTPFGVCRIRAGAEVGAAAEPDTVGTLAHIIDCDMQQLGLLLARTRGGDRFRILSSQTTRQGLIVAHVEILPPGDDAPLPEAYRACVRLLNAVASQQKEAPFLDPQRPDSARWVGHRLSEILPLPGPIRQQLLELDDSLARLQILMQFLEKHGLVIR